MRRVILTFSAALAGCTANPNNIQPAYVSPLQYQSLDCDQLKGEFDRVASRWAELDNLLMRRHDRDVAAVGGSVVLTAPAILLKNGSSASLEAEFAVVSGQQRALIDVTRANSCRPSQRQIDERLRAEEESKAEAQRSKAESDAAFKAMVEEIANKPKA